MLRPATRPIRPGSGIAVKLSIVIPNPPGPNSGVGVAVPVIKNDVTAAGKLPAPKSDGTQSPVPAAETPFMVSDNDPLIAAGAGLNTAALSAIVWNVDRSRPRPLTPGYAIVKEATLGAGSM